MSVALFDKGIRGQTHANVAIIIGLWDTGEELRAIVIDPNGLITTEELDWGSGKGFKTDLRYDYRGEIWVDTTGEDDGEDGGPEIPGDLPDADEEDGGHPDTGRGDNYRVLDPRGAE